MPLKSKGGLFSPPTLSGKPLAAAPMMPPVPGGKSKSSRALPAVAKEKKRRAVPLPPPTGLAPGLPSVTIAPLPGAMTPALKGKGSTINPGGPPVILPPPGPGGPPRILPPGGIPLPPGRR